jgi:predicted DNA-binding WGR domain protein
LKLYSSEGEDQTQRYVDDSYIGLRQKSRFPDHGQHYVYIRRPDHPQANACKFVNITWQQVKEWFQPLMTNNYGRYPSRTAAQLADFLDTIQQDMTQDEHIQTAQEKMRLYFNHEDAIREARNGLQTAYEYERDNRRRRFIDEYLPENWSPDWHINPNRYGQIYHTKWRQDEGLAIDDADIRMHFVHLIRNKESFEDGKLTFQLRWPGESRYRERFKELFVGERFADELDAQLGEYNINKKADYNPNNPRFIEKVYPVVKTGLPESYYEELQQATREHIDVAPVINEMLDTAIEEVEREISSGEKG